MRSRQHTLGAAPLWLAPWFRYGWRERAWVAAAGLAVLALSPWAGAPSPWFAVPACSALTYLVVRYCVKRARDDRAHYRRAWEVLALAIVAKAAWETVALVAPQPWSASVWGQALQAGLAGLGFSALAIGFYVFSFLAVGQEQSAAHRSPLRVDILLISAGLASITVLTVPVLRSIPGSGEVLAAAIGGLLCVGAVMALLIAEWRAPDFELEHFQE